LQIPFHIDNILALFRHMKISGHLSATNPSATSSAAGTSAVATSTLGAPGNWQSQRTLSAASLATVLVEAAAWTSKSCAIMRSASYKSVIANSSVLAGAQGEHLPIDGGNERK
jgi:hypothetical protein